MSEWTRICCAVDFSDPSRAAMHRATNLARRLAAELTLIHVVPAPPPAASDVLVSSRGVAAVAAQEATETLATWRSTAEERSGRPVRSAILSGDPATEILRAARDEQCDLVVIGTHGRTGLSRLVLGSVAERVVRQSACSVLVARDRESLDKESETEEAEQYSAT